MRMGQSIGLTDQLLRDIHVGDLLTDADKALQLWAGRRNF